MSVPVLTLLSKPGCHLCREMAAEVERLFGDRVLLEEKDITSDPDLERRFRLEIPVLLLGQTEVARHRVSEAELRTRLEALGIRQGS
ncbi:MAG TPA: glutaredoxin family protein [Vicinamibacteria bacterium]|nr:glutaredoxin family protein [Vicinamibacteria bacterium]